jgi:hypothetical protein
MNLAYLTSLPHSGSTVFNLLAGTHPEIVGLGEVEESVKRVAGRRDEYARATCSCGETVPGCPVWGRVFEAVKSDRPGSRRERYAAAAAAFRAAYGDATWAVDTSKLHEPLAELAGYDGFDLRAVHLVRDVRGSIVSMAEVKRRKSGRRGAAPFRAVELGWKWWRRNLKIARALDGLGVPHLRLGYEESCFAPGETLGLVAKLLGAGPPPAAIDLRESKHHLIVGNRMRRDPDKQSLQYDPRWLGRSDWLPAVFVMPWLLPMNSKWVYGNGVQGKWFR